MTYPDRTMPCCGGHLGEHFETCPNARPIPPVLVHWFDREPTYEPLNESQRAGHYCVKCGLPNLTHHEMQAAGRVTGWGMVYQCWPKCPKEAS